MPPTTVQIVYYAPVTSLIKFLEILIILSATLTRHTNFLGTRGVDPNNSH